MSHLNRTVTFLILTLTIPAASAGAQPRPPSTPQSKPQSKLQSRPRTDPRFLVSVNGGYQPSTTHFDDTFTFRLHQEDGSTRVSYPVDAGPTFDGGVGVRVWRRLGVGIAVAGFSVDEVVKASASLPHPFLLQRFREVSGELGGMRRQETAVHLQAQYTLPTTGKLQVTLMAGPSLLKVSQSIVTEVNYTEEYPYDTAAFSGLDSRLVKTDATGFNAGMDVRWMFARHIGAGALLRFTRASIDLAAGTNRTISVDVGGPQVGGGVRLSF